MALNIWLWLTWRLCRPLWGWSQRRHFRKSSKHWFDFSGPLKYDYGLSDAKGWEDAYMKVMAELAPMSGKQRLEYAQRNTVAKWTDPNDKWEKRGI